MNNGVDLAVVPGVPGILSNCPNVHVQVLKEHPWSCLPSLLGNSAERIIGDMLLECGIFQPVEKSNNLSQLSGVPLCELKPLKSIKPPESYFPSGDVQQISTIPRTLRLERDGESQTSASYVIVCYTPNRS